MRVSVKIKEIYSRNLNGVRQFERVFGVVGLEQTEEEAPIPCLESGNIVSLMALKKMLKRRY